MAWPTCRIALRDPAGGGARWRGALRGRQAGERGPGALGRSGLLLGGTLVLLLRLDDRLPGASKGSVPLGGEVVAAELGRAPRGFESEALH